MFLGGTVSIFSRLGRRTNPQRLPRDLVLTEITAEGPRSARAAITWTPEDDDNIVMEEEEEDCFEDLTPTASNSTPCKFFFTLE